ncbi:hypothetical protein D3C77_345430 [compost metagenome]
MLHKLFIDLIICKSRLARLLLLLKAHARPNVRINDVSLRYRCLRIAHNLNNRSSLLGDLLSLGCYFRIRLIAFRAGYRNMHPKLCAADHEGMRHIVTVADISQLQTF